MELTFNARAEVWRGRGRRPRQVPDEVLNMLRRTYGTDTVGVVRLGPDDGAKEVAELLSLLRAGARQLGQYRVRIQREAQVIRYEMVDRAGGTEE